MKPTDSIVIKNISCDYVENRIDDFLGLIKNWKYGDWDKSSFLLDVKLKWSYSFSIEHDNELIGFCFASGKIDRVYYIHLLFLSESYRGLGIMTSVFESIIERCRRYDLKTIELYCPIDNELGLKFYRSKKFILHHRLSDEKQCYLVRQLSNE